MWVRFVSILLSMILTIYNIPIVTFATTDDFELPPTTFESYLRDVYGFDVSDELWGEFEEDFADFHIKYNEGIGSLIDNLENTNTTGADYYKSVISEGNDSINSLLKDDGGLNKAYIDYIETKSIDSNEEYIEWFNDEIELYYIGNEADTNINGITDGKDYLEKLNNILEVVDTYIKKLSEGNTLEVQEPTLESVVTSGTDSNISGTIVKDADDMGSLKELVEDAKQDLLTYDTTLGSYNDLHKLIYYNFMFNLYNANAEEKGINSLSYDIINNFPDYYINGVTDIEEGLKLGFNHYDPFMRNQDTPSTSNFYSQSQLRDNSLEEFDTYFDLYHNLIATIGGSDYIAKYINSYDYILSLDANLALDKSNINFACEITSFADLVDIINETGVVFDLTKTEGHESYLAEVISGIDFEETKYGDQNISCVYYFIKEFILYADMFRPLANTLYNKKTGIITYLDYDESYLINISNSISNLNIILEIFGEEPFVEGYDDKVDIEEYKDEISEKFSTSVVEELIGNIYLEDLFDIEDGKATMSEAYKELLAYSASFVPFESSINSVMGSAIALSNNASDLAIKYGSYKQPLTYVVSTNVDTYNSIINGDINSLKYLTLRDFVNMTLNSEDVFIFINTASTDQIKDSSIENITIMNQITITGDGEVIDTVDSEIDTNSTGLDLNSSLATNVTGETSSTGFVTANSRFYGPVYTSSTNTGNKEIHESVVSNNFTGDTVSVSDDWVVIGSLTNSNNDEVEIDALTAASFALQAQDPDSGFLNHMFMWNVLQEEQHLKSNVIDVLDDVLYMDFLGNIVAKNGVIIVPAIANASRLSNLENYNMLNAMFINFYPDITESSFDGIDLTGFSQNKYFFYNTNTRFTESFNFVKNTLGDIGEGIGDAVTGFAPNITAGVTDFLNPIKEGIGKLLTSDKKINLNKSGELLSIGRFGLNNSSGGIRLQHEIPLGRFNQVIYNENMSLENDIENVALITFDTASLIKYETPIKLNITGPVDYVFSWGLSPKGLEIAVGSEIAKAQLKAIPPNHNSAEAIALTQIAISYLLDFYDSDSYNNLIIPDINLKIAMAIFNGSPDPEIIDFIKVTAEDILKSSSVNNTFGKIFEGFYSTIFGAFEVNFLTFSPTINNLDIAGKMIMCILPFGVMFLFFLTVYLLFKVFTNHRGNSGIKLSDALKVLIVTVSSLFFIMNFMNPFIDFIYKSIPNRLMENENLLMIAYNLENFNNSSDNNFFAESSVSFNYDTSVTLLEVSSSEARVYRQMGGRNDVDHIFYTADYDSSKQTLFDDIYLQNTSVKIDIDDLLNNSSIDILATDGFDVQYEQRINSSTISNLIFYTPFYHFEKAITDIVNEYNNVVSNYYSTIYYDNGVIKTTGRAKTYFDSIFFIAPESIEEYVEYYMFSMADKSLHLELDPSDILGYDEGFTSYTGDSSAEYSITDSLLEVTNLIDEKFADRKTDWLSLYPLLGFYQNTAPFSVEEVSSATNALWYPAEQYRSTDRISYEAIERVNRKVREFVLNYIVPSANQMSDETIIKVVALKATLEYNREFGKYTNISAENYGLANLFEKIYKFNTSYPKIIESDYSSNDFFTKLIYMPTYSIFLGTGESLAYYLTSNAEVLGVMIVLVERLLLLFRFSIRLIAVGILFISVIMMYLSFVIFKNEHAVTCWKFLTIISFIISVPLHLIEMLFFKLSIYMIGSLDLSKMLLLNLVVGLILSRAYLMLLKEIDLAFRNQFAGTIQKIKM